MQLIAKYYFQKDLKGYIAHLLIINLLEVQMTFCTKLLFKHKPELLSRGRHIARNLSLGEETQSNHFQSLKAFLGYK